MIARGSVVGLAMMIGLALPLGAAAAAANPRGSEEAVLKRQDAAAVAVAEEDDDARDADSRSGTSRGSTNSRRTPVTRNRDRSRGGLTRDRTRDGKGGPRRDWSRHQTNDRSRNDSR